MVDSEQDDLEVLIMEVDVGGLHCNHANNVATMHISTHYNFVAGVLSTLQRH